MLIHPLTRNGRWILFGSGECKAKRREKVFLWINLHCLGITWNWSNSFQANEITGLGIAALVIRPFLTFSKSAIVLLSFPSSLLLSSFFLSLSWNTSILLPFFFHLIILQSCFLYLVFHVRLISSPFDIFFV